MRIVDIGNIGSRARVTGFKVVPFSMMNRDRVVLPRWTYPRLVHGPRASMTQRCGGQGVGKSSPTGGTDGAIRTNPRGRPLAYPNRLFDRVRHG